MTVSSVERPWEARFRGFRVLEVLRCAPLTPGMRRITLGGDEFVELADGPNVKLLVPPVGVREPEWPRQAPDGSAIWPAEEKRPVVRTFTVRRFDAAARELDIDFLLHGEGMASNWAGAAAPGDRIGVGKPGGLTIREADWYLLAGDQSALPAIARILEQLPASARGWAFVDVPSRSEIQAVVSRSQVQLVWLTPGSQPGGGNSLVDAVRSVVWPPAGVRPFAWIAGESSSVRALRDYVRRERGLDHQQHLAVGYWKRGMTEPEYHRAHDHDRDADYKRSRAQESASRE